MKDTDALDRAAQPLLKAAKGKTERFAIGAAMVAAAKRFLVCRDRYLDGLARLARLPLPDDEGQDNGRPDSG
jgi:hypothetical protein